MGETIKFGTDGWRAIIADEFTFANVERVAYAVGIYVKQTYHQGSGAKVPVLVGYDTRFLADKFAKRAAQVLISMGVPAKLATRDVPTPAIAFATQLEPTAGALQLTASHNPPEYCGIKYIPHYAGPATNAITTQIVSNLQAMPTDFVIENCEVESFDIRPQYLKALGKLVDFKRIGGTKLKVAYDAIYSTSRDYLDYVLKENGLNCVVLHNWRDPLFGGGMPEPKAEYLKELIKTVKEEKCDVGIATDGDADRFAVIDEKGTYFSPNQLLCLLTRHLVKNRNMKGAIVRTVATTHLLDRLAEMYGLKVFETPVGFKYVGEIMRAEDVLIGGEESGGVSVRGHIPEKDGILANLLLIEMMAYEGKPLSQIWNDLLKEAGLVFIGRRADLHLSKPTQKALMEHLIAKPFNAIGSEGVVKIGTDDGLKFYLEDKNWILVRPSGTEPLIRLYFEGVDEQLVDALVVNFQKQIDEVVKTLGQTSGQAQTAKVGAH
jgi:phosphomannomutase